MSNHNSGANFYGLNIDPSNHDGGSPEAMELQGLGVQSVRFVFKDSSGGSTPDPERVSFYQQKLKNLTTAEVSALVILNNETLAGCPGTAHSGPPPSSAAWDNYINRFAERAGQLAQALADWQPAFEIWNEPDLSQTSPGFDPTLHPQVFGRLLDHSYAAIKHATPQLKVTTAGLVSGQPAWLQEVINSLDNHLPADAVAIHPYTKRPETNWPDSHWGTGYVGDLINGYRQVTHLPLWISEIGFPAPDEQLHAEYLRRFYKTMINRFSDTVERVYWFCYADKMQPPFGLLDGNMHQKSAYTAYRETASTSIMAAAAPTAAALDVASNVYIVRSGDTLFWIAQHYGLTLTKLLALNPQIEDANMISPGQKINVPTLLPDHLSIHAAAVAQQDEAAWFAIAKREMETGVDEIPGPRHNPRIVEYHQTTTLKATDDETDWCSSFVNWCVEQAGFVGTKSAAARSWLNWGRSLNNPRRGCLVIFRRPNGLPWQGHVGFYFAKDGERLLILGGNQGDQVNISSFPQANVLGYRWPDG